MAKRSQRNASNQATGMSSEQYWRLIGNFKHIEQKALREEVANEFAAIASNNGNSSNCFNNKLLSPAQPPPLPLEINQAQQQSYQATVAWPPSSTLHKAVTMLFDTQYPRENVIQFLRTHKKMHQSQIDSAIHICDLMEQSRKYLQKVSAMKDSYKARYDTKTRQQSLQTASWDLQIALTLTEFHIDHIVDIMHQKEFWANDYNFDAHINIKQIDATDEESESDTNSTQSLSSAAQQFVDSEVEYQQKNDQQLSQNNKNEAETKRNTSVAQTESLDDMFQNMFGGDGNIAFSGFATNDQEQETEAVEQTSFDDTNTENFGKFEFNGF